MVARSALFTAAIWTSLLSFALLSSAQAEDRGKSIYDGTCVVCHGKDGKGALPGTPDFNKKSGVLTKSDEELARSVLNGYQSPGSPLAMPPKGGNPSLTQADVGAVVQYLRAAFGR